jgi:4-hydroxy-2-oxoheptanedioate aldolase
MASLVSRLRAGEAVYSAWSAIPDAVTVEVLTQAGFDAVALDMQHGGHHEDSVLRSIGAIVRAEKLALVRIPVGRFDMASRALDFGADAVIAPMVNSVEDAKRFAAAMKFPPVGERSWGAGFALARRQIGDPQVYLREANAATLAFAMIETRTALDVLDGILAVEGIDGVFVGPSDFSIAWSGGEVVNPALEDMMEAIGAIAGRAAVAGKFAAIYIVDPALTARYAKMGFRLFAFGNEGRYMSLGAATILKTARA